MTIETLQGSIQGLKLAKKFLYKNVDRKTVLFLSGGSTPKLLYQNLAKEKKLEVGAVALVDERYGKSFHSKSNERMIKEAGFLDYLNKNKISFYRMIQDSYRHSGDQAKPETPESLITKTIPIGDSGQARMTLEQAARIYGEIVSNLFTNFPKRIAIMGIGEDGHTAGLPAKVKSQKLKVKSYVTEIRNFPGEFKERITLTFKALSKMDLLIVLVFGTAKQKALNQMFAKGLEEEIPARFFNRPDIAKKTILITDQKVYNNY